MKQQQQPRRIMRVPEVCAATGAGCKRTVRRWEELGLFPRSIQIGPKKIRGWFEDEVIAWQEDQARNAVAPPADEDA